ncbi:hypothetical protein FGG08_000430 [Glutinoglossum americanum]|uniref:AAA+ ATPase domain-containing protein n=1 Tax=Glutinoglossum americanum TaxID=1670608 RepID=A0A9P8L618_9PEZI|nr:hypothetical protein FGG08_000430 [Glutinoglossum americanum]
MQSGRGAAKREPSIGSGIIGRTTGTAMDQTQTPTFDAWQVVVDHAAAFQAVETGPDAPEIICKADELPDVDTKLQFVRVDEKTEIGEGGLLQPIYRVVNPFGSISSSVPNWESGNELNPRTEYAFVVRRIFARGNNILSYSLVDIQSRHLKDIMRLVFWEEQHSSYFMNYETPSLPPQVILTRLPELVKLWNELTEPDCKQDPLYAAYLKLLLDYIQTDYADSIASLLEHLKDGVAGCSNLGALFRPDQLVVRESGDELQILKCTSISGSSGFGLDVKARRVEYDGSEFGVAAEEIRIADYKGLKKITDLVVYPLPFALKTDEIWQDALERGRKYVALRGILHREYKGPVFGTTQHTYEGRIVVDPYAFYRKSNTSLGLRPLSTLASRLLSADKLGRRAEPNCPDSGTVNACGMGPSFANSYITSASCMDPIYPNTGAYGVDTIQDYYTANLGVTTPQMVRGSIYPRQPGAEASHTALAVSLTEEELLLCPPYIPGFALADKVYCHFLVRQIKDIKWNPTAFDQVIIPDRLKRLLLSMVRGHNAYRTGKGSRSDIIEGKGKGLVTLLHGPPGVGKTVTVEAIVEQTRQPLYVVSAAELGTSAMGLEKSLSNIFDVAFAWNAPRGDARYGVPDQWVHSGSTLALTVPQIVLVDEADVFLEARSLDFFRSELVTVFLRELEYFQGILMLTTNRVQRFDRALRSRIHLALKFNELDKEARLKVWKSALSTAEWVGGEAELKRLTRRVVNGREVSLEKTDPCGPNRAMTVQPSHNPLLPQIKYCVRSATALAEQDNEPLAVSHFETVLDLAAEFERELEEGKPCDDSK